MFAAGANKGKVTVCNFFKVEIGFNSIKEEFGMILKNLQQTFEDFRFRAFSELELSAPPTQCTLCK